jgi:isoquinoline 1-oxidoreductase beta subunit
MASLSKLNRREFLRVTGLASVGLALHATVNLSASSPAAAAGLKSSAGTGASLNVFVHIAANNRVTIMAHRSEMGQGVRTSLPQVVADELDADWDKVDILQAQGDEKYGDQNTDGSNSVRNFYQPMRELGASARLMLRQAAAAKWRVPLESCIAKDHRVTHTTSGRSLSYGELAEAAAALPIPDTKKLVFKSPQEFKYIGKPMSMADFGDILRGTTTFGIDTNIPDMVHASIERCPVLGGKVQSFDASRVLAIPGVLQVVKIDGGIEPAGFNPLAGVAVIASNTWAALEGRKALSITWVNNVAHTNYDSRAVIAKLIEAPRTEARIVASHGDVAQAFASATQTHEATYSLPHLEHATMEPPAATARISGNTCEVWACVQDPMTARKLVAEMLGFRLEDVTINVTLLGGGFGRKSKPDFVLEAVMLAKATGKSVKVTWSREDTTRHGYYHAFSVQHYKAALAANHRILGLDSSVASPSILSLTKTGNGYMQDWELGQGFTSNVYDVPNFRASNIPVTAHTRIGWLRSVYAGNHGFGMNSFMDELARLNNLDTLQYHLDSLPQDDGSDGQEGNDFAYRPSRLRSAIHAVKTSSGWPAPVVATEGWGFATFRSFDSYVAVATKVSLANGELRVLEVHISIDCGQVLNPDRVRSQMEGSVIFALSGALMGEISFKDGAVEQSSFNDYPVLRLSQSPKIIVTLIDSDRKHSGVGEPGVPPVAASITNAIVAAGGPRIRDLPIKRHLQVA